MGVLPTSDLAADPRSKPRSRISSLHLTVSIRIALTAPIPRMKPNCIVRYIPARAGALCFLPMDAWMEVKTDARAMPVPKPLGAMYRASHVVVFPCHVKKRRRYENEDARFPKRRIGL